MEPIHVILDRGCDGIKGKVVHFFERTDDFNNRIMSAIFIRNDTGSIFVVDLDEITELK